MEVLKLEEFINYKFISGLKISPEGNWLGYVISKANLEENGYTSTIEIYNIVEKKKIALTTLGAEKSFIWLDEKRILFPTVRNKQDKKDIELGKEITIFYEISTEGGEAQEKFRLPYNVTSIEKIGEEKFIFTATYFPPKPNPLPDDFNDYEILDEIPYWSNGGGFTNKKRNRLYIYDLREDRVKSITDELTDVSGYRIKGEKVLYVSVKYSEKMPLTNEVIELDLKTEEKKIVVAGDKYSIEYADYVGEIIVMAASEMKRYGLNENPWFYTIKDEKIEILFENDLSIGNSVGSDCRLGANKKEKVDGEWLYYITTKGKSSFINRINLKGEMEELSADVGAIDGIDILNGKIYFVGMRGQKLQEIYGLENEKEIQITKLNEDFLEGKYVAVPERIEFINAEGIAIEGFILKPVEYDPEKKYPAILDIHGGPKTAYGEIFYHEMQYWAGQGYFVFFCNPRGSDGRGNEFADIRGKYGTIDYDDIMKFTDTVLEKYPQIDKGKIGVTGGSYGGFMTNWIIGHTDRFRCAATQRSIANWVTEFGVTDIGYYFVPDQIAADPWSDVEKLWEHSPMKYANKIKTPTLIIHSNEDYRCWLPEGLQLFTSLKYHGVPARLCMFKGENHELSRSGKPKHRIKRLKEISDWFEKYLK